MGVNQILIWNHYKFELDVDSQVFVQQNNYISIEFMPSEHPHHLAKDLLLLIAFFFFNDISQHFNAYETILSKSRPDRVYVHRPALEFTVLMDLNFIINLS